MKWHWYWSMFVKVIGHYMRARFFDDTVLVSNAHTWKDKKWESIQKLMLQAVVNVYGFGREREIGGKQRWCTVWGHSRHEHWRLWRLDQSLMMVLCDRWQVCRGLEAEQMLSILELDRLTLNDCYLVEMKLETLNRPQTTVQQCR